LALIALAATALLLTGCSSRGVYEGIQQQEAVRNPPPTGQPAQRKPSYDEYEAERRKQSAPPAGY
jgi:PBP1b-binding outer membrane lipoprotein LpoB